MKAIKFTKAALEKLKQTDHTYRVQDDQTVGLSIEVRATPSTLKVFYAEWSNIVIDKNGKQKRWGSRRKVCRYGQKPIEAVKKVVNANLDEWKKIHPKVVAKVVRYRRKTWSRGSMLVC